MTRPRPIPSASPWPRSATFYGIRHLRVDQAARTLRVEFDATRLTPAAVTSIVRLTGLDIAEELPLFPPTPAPQPAPAA